MYSVGTLPYPRHIGLKHVKEFKLDSPLFVGDAFRTHIVPAGTVVKVYQSQNFGVCVIPPNIVPWGQQIFRY
jgi:hypothetical protein